MVVTTNTICRFIHEELWADESISHYFAEEENTEGDNPPIGIVLGAYKNEVLVKYATTGLTNQLFVSKYQLYLPDEKALRHEVQRILEQE